MQGSIRVGIGFLFVFGAVGGMDTSTDLQLVLESLVAVLGLSIMYSGVSAMNRGIQ